ncbi:hypothetical protein HEK616_42730 [Streptomyces nigrescens]|uniref:Uncharacterized protein n=2 Tax=Streptomyces TaxID=1883 RepID=A0ABN6QYF5_STRNI|nr:hypothetical protein [Streptomyces nigrescens]MEE4422191.1 hypothetical protein [Streptomyces sp. DSM 41528]BDM70786.1 hypothetical protein HEK616_42730 [Streptomyces nigrescens]
MAVHGGNLEGGVRISDGSAALSDAPYPPLDALHRAIQAARRALHDSAVGPGDLDAIIYVVRRRQVPPRWQSARVAYALGAREDIAALDIPGSRAAQCMAAALSVPGGPVRRVLIVEAEGTARPSASLVTG